MKREYEVNLKDVLRRVEIIKENTKGMDYEEFKNSEWDVSAVVRNLEVIGEAVANLPDDFKKAHPEVEWRDIKGFRNLAIHQYWNVDKEIVWEIVQDELNPLQQKIEKILES
ncbi:MAG: DUF86 domain-containing protein [Candidatus Natronoplasma sp.]